MNKSINFAFRCGVLLLCYLFAAVAFSQNLATRFDKYMKEREKNRAVFSGVVLVAKDGKIIFHKAYGMADYELSVPNNLQTKFRIGSNTKSFTALAVMILSEKGKLNLQDSICKYVKDCPDEWKGVTIHHLLTHTSGLPDLFGDMKSTVPVEGTAAEIDRVIANVPNKKLKQPPGEIYEYSNFGYCLLGYIIEKSSGELYATFLNNYIFRPLGMGETLYDDPRPVIINRANGYKRQNGRISNDKLTDPAAYSAGGLLSTAKDLLLLDQALYSTGLLSKNGLSQMFTNYKNEYGYGWKVTNQFGKKVFNHRGGTHGFSSYMARYPEEKWLIVALGNFEDETSSSSIPRAIACDMAAMIFGFEENKSNEAVKADETRLLKYVGQYNISSGAPKNIKLAQGQLVYESGANSYKLIPLSPTVFYPETIEEYRVRFGLDQNGRVTEMIVSSCGKEEFKAIKSTP